MDNNADEYEPTDSEEEYNEDEREILENLRKQRMQREEQQNQNQEVLLFSDSDDEDDLAETMRDSDIEGAEDDDFLPDTMNWGSKKSTYYNTDFVDADYSSYNAQEEELALAEEEEAKKIQLRLAKQIRESDFKLDDMELSASDSDDSSAVNQHAIKVAADLTGLNERERLQLLQKDSPEFIGLIQEFEQNMNEMLLLSAPVLNYVRNHQVPIVPALQYANIYQKVMLTYCANISYYLLLKSKRRHVAQHPVVKRLLQLTQLRKQLLPRYENYIRPQLEALLEHIQNGDAFTVLDVEQRKAKLQILKQYERSDDNNLAAQANGLDDDTDDSHDEDEDSKVSAGENKQHDESEEQEDTRRSITYQMAKNKGLMPHRKKELRNPRVKHRGKYRKALIRRKGAVRSVRKEVQRYGGEISGIKSTVSKSIKFKT